MTTSSMDAFDQPPAGEYGAPADTQSRKPLIFVALAVVAALLIGGGAFAITRALGGGGDQPASALPGDSIAYMRLDIDPSLGQKIAAMRFLQGMDGEARELLESDDVRQAFFERLQEEEAFLAEIDYDTDIEPWLGDRLGMSMVPNGEAEPLVAVALAVNDEAAAEEGLTRLISAADTTADEVGVGWFFHGDYIVLGESSTVTTIQTLVEAGTLADNDTFRADMGDLGDPGVMSGWADLSRMAEFADEAAGMASTVDPYGPAGSLGSLFGDSADFQAEDLGRVAGALRFGEDHIEMSGIIRGFEVGLPEGAFSGSTPQVLLGLPEDTAVAIGMEHGSDYAQLMWDQLSEMMPEDMEMMRAEAAAEGVRLPDDLKVFLGDSLVLSAGPGVAQEANWEDPSTLPIAYHVATDTDRLAELSQLVRDEMGPDASLLIENIQDGVATFGLQQAYVDQVAAGGSLADNPLFQAAVPDADGADSIMYVDLNAFEHLYLDQVDAQWRDSLASIGAIGVSSEMEGSDGSFTFRLVANP